jgi:hypothetical protein
MDTVRVRKPWMGVLFVLSALLLGLWALAAYGRGTAEAWPQQSQVIEGPIVGAPVAPYVLNADLRSLPATEGDEEPLGPLPLRYVPGSEPKGSAPQLVGWHDPVVQRTQGLGQMPDPIANFLGMTFSTGGAGWPPDTNGDVGPNHYVQTVNTSMAVYNKSTGAEMIRMTLNAFFTGTGTLCDTNNYGDPVVVYDRLADRWVITDFAFTSPSTPPFYECVAVSQTGDPVGGGWYFYAFLISNTALNDYPKLGVWPDAYYITFNMFIPPAYDWDGVQVWALERAEMLNGAPASTISFSLGPETGYGSLMPANMQSTPPAGAPNYVASLEPLDKFQLWEFDVDWVTPANSTFTGPTVLTIADFAIAQSVPQLGSTALLDSLSFRPMMQLQYREVNGVESLWVNHSVAAEEGVGGVRWYEVQDPGGTPVLAQQGTFQPDEHHRWMGSVAVDQDGNMAVGYSVSSATLRPAIRYAGRQYGEAPGVLTQAEAVLYQGAGSQTGTTRWGDYSHMTVDPTDDCTFWYTTEYYAATGTNWQTRIGSFRFPSCGQPKGWIEGTVRNAVTLEPIEGAIVAAESVSQTMSVETDSNGTYSMTVMGGTFDVLATPLLPGYPVSSTVEVVTAVAGTTDSADLYLDPVPYLVEDSVTLDDSAGNGNGYAEPGEAGIILWEDLLNTGALTATNVTAELTALTAGVTVQTANADYPDVPAGETMTNSTPFTFAVDSSVVCGTDLEFEKTVTSDEGTWTIAFSLNASEPLPPAEVFNNDVEGGAAGWTTGGAPAWVITTEDAHSPTHSWTDSPGGNYGNNVTSWVRTPAFSLTDKRNVELSGWYKWELETGYDYVYLDYSLNGGITWSGNNEALTVFNGFQEEWTEVVVDASILDGAPNVALRWRLVSDGGVVEDGIHLDDLVLSYEPYQCTYDAPEAPDAPMLVSPADNATVSSPVTFVWMDSGTGGTPTGYVLDVDGTVYTFTTPVTTTTMALDPGSHTWKVQAFNTGGSSVYSSSWSFTVAMPEVEYLIYLPVVIHK